MACLSGGSYISQAFPSWTIESQGLSIPGSRRDKKRRRRKRDERQRMTAWWKAEMAFQCPVDASPFRVFLTRQSGRRLLFRLTASITQTRSSISDGSKRRSLLKSPTLHSWNIHFTEKRIAFSLMRFVAGDLPTYLPIRLSFVLARIRFLINNGLAHTRRDNATMVFRVYVG